eukprot:gene156-4402_t
MKPVTIITGGAKGLGKCIVQYLISKNYQVVAADIDEEAGKILENEFKSNSNFKFIKTDVSNEESVSNLIKETISTFKTINSLINNAAISNPYLSNNLENISLEEWNKFMNVNLTSIFLCSKYSIPHLKKENNSSIINIASTRALMSEKNTEGYSATKGGVVSLTHSMAISLGEQVKVNCISPGWIDTSAYQNKETVEEYSKEDHKQHPAGRIGVPQDIAEMCYFLLNQNGFITGQNFVIDGGMTKKMIYEE